MYKIEYEGLDGTLNVIDEPLCEDYAGNNAILRGYLYYLIIFIMNKVLSLMLWYIISWMDCE